MNTETSQALADLAGTVRAAKVARETARTDFLAHRDFLASLLSGNSGQSARAAAVIRSLWNGELCDWLAGNDGRVNAALVSAIAYRAHASGDADEDLRAIANLANESAPES